MMFIFFILLVIALSQLTKVGGDLVLDDADAFFNSPVHLDSGLVANVFLDETNNYEVRVILIDPSGATPSILGSTVVIEGNSTYDDDELHMGALHIGGERLLVQFANNVFDKNELVIIDCSSGTTCTADSPVEIMYGYVDHYGRGHKRGVYMGNGQAVVFLQNDPGVDYFIIGFVFDVSSSMPVKLSGPTQLYTGGCNTPPGCPFDPEGGKVMRTGSNEFVLSYGLYDSSNASLIVNDVMGRKYTIEANVITPSGSTFVIIDSGADFAYYGQVTSLYGGEGYLLVTYSIDGGRDNGNTSYGDYGVFGVIFDTTPATPVALGPSFVLSSPIIDADQNYPTADAFRSHRAFVVSWTDNFNKNNGSYVDGIYAGLFCFSSNGQPTIVGQPMEVSINAADEYFSTTTVSGSRAIFTWEESSNDALTASIWEADLSSCEAISSSSGSSSAANLESFFY